MLYYIIVSKIKQNMICGQVLGGETILCLAYWIIPI